MVIELDIFSNQVSEAKISIKFLKKVIFLNNGLYFNFK